MRDELREKLNTEITRKEFLRYLAAGALMLFGLNNLLALLSSHKGTTRYIMVPGSGSPDGFGTRKFGM